MATDEELRAEAVDRLQARRGFYVHLGVYIIVNAALFAQWAIVTPGAGYWPVWTLLGWGIGLAFHGLAVFVRNRQPDEARIEREVTKMRGHTGGPAPTA